MNKQIEALKMAIESLETADAIVAEYSGVYFERIQPAIQACKEALAESEKQEPVAWMEEYQSCKVNGDERLCHSDKVFRLVQLLASQSKEWQSLSDGEIAELNPHCYADELDLDFARAIEQALKEKNHG